MVKVKEFKCEAEEQPQSSSSSGGGVSHSSSNGRKSQKRKGSPRKLSSSSIDNMEEVSPSNKAKLDTVEERGRAPVGGDDGGTKREGEGDGKEEIQTFTFEPLPLKVSFLVEC